VGHPVPESPNSDAAAIAVASLYFLTDLEMSYLGEGNQTRRSLPVYTPRPKYKNPAASIFSLKIMTRNHVVQGNTSKEVKKGSNLDFRLPPRCWCDLRSSGATQRRVLIVYRRFGTTYRPHFKGQEVQEEILTLEDGTDTLSRNVGKQLLHDAA
jgi:hypothetical protein